MEADLLLLDCSPSADGRRLALVVQCALNSEAIGRLFILIARIGLIVLLSGATQALNNWPAPVGRLDPWVCCTSRLDAQCMGRFEVFTHHRPIRSLTLELKVEKRTRMVTPLSTESISNLR